MKDPELKTYRQFEQENKRLKNQELQGIRQGMDMNKLFCRLVGFHCPSDMDLQDSCPRKKISNCTTKECEKCWAKAVKYD